MDDRLAIFKGLQRRLHGIAYRMLGSNADAEDLVQEAYVRWHRVDLVQVRTPEAWLVTTITRLCIDRLRLARTERDAYIGPWLPEPMTTESAPPAEATIELASDLSIAFLIVLERLAPEERAAFLLHDIFDSDYEDIARILRKSETACRQLVSRARQRVRQERPRFKVSEASRTHLLERFVKALRAQDYGSVLSLFAADATWTSDGGGKANAARKVVRNGDLISRFLLGIWRRYLGRMTASLTTINGETGLMFCDGDQPIMVATVITDGTKIIAGLAIVNPEKLRRVSSTDARSLATD